jgi:hypothetical protein
MQAVKEKVQAKLVGAGTGGFQGNDRVYLFIKGRSRGDRTMKDLVRAGGRSRMLPHVPIPSPGLHHPSMLTSFCLPLPPALPSFVGQPDLRAGRHLAPTTMHGRAQGRCMSAWWRRIGMTP